MIYIYRLFNGFGTEGRRREDGGRTEGRRSDSRLISSLGVGVQYRPCGRLQPHLVVAWSGGVSIQTGVKGGVVGGSCDIRLVAADKVAIRIVVESRRGSVEGVLVVFGVAVFDIAACNIAHDAAKQCSTDIAHEADAVDVAVLYAATGHSAHQAAGIALGCGGGDYGIAAVVEAVDDAPLDEAVHYAADHFAAQLPFEPAVVDLSRSVYVFLHYAAHAR